MTAMTINREWAEALVWRIYEEGQFLAASGDGDAAELRVAQLVALQALFAPGPFADAVQEQVVCLENRIKTGPPWAYVSVES